MIFSEIVERTVVISLASCHDRRRRITDHLRSFSVNFQYFDAIHPDENAILWKDIRGMDCYGGKIGLMRSNYVASALGCRLSHLAVLEQALQDKIHNLLVLEDDCVLRDQWEATFGRAYQELPHSYWQLYLSSQHFPRLLSPVAYSSQLQCLREAFGTLGILYSATGISNIIPLLRRSNQELDVFYAKRIHPVRKSFCISPHIAMESGDTSSIYSGQRLPRS